MIKPRGPSLTTAVVVGVYFGIMCVVLFYVIKGAGLLAEHIWRVWL